MNVYNFIVDRKVIPTKTFDVPLKMFNIFIGTLQFPRIKLTTTNCESLAYANTASVTPFAYLKKKSQISKWITSSTPI